MQTFKQWIVGLDLFPLYRNPADFAAAMREEYEKERRMVTRLNLQQKS